MISNGNCSDHGMPGLEKWIPPRIPPTRAIRTSTAAPALPLVFIGPTIGSLATSAAYQYFTHGDNSFHHIFNDSCGRCKCNLHDQHQMEILSVHCKGNFCGGISRRIAARFCYRSIASGRYKPARLTVCPTRKFPTRVVWSSQTAFPDSQESGRRVTAKKL